MYKNRMINPLEQQLWAEYPRILGMDEAGRGPLAGPLVVAGVIFPAGYVNEEIFDSKKLTPKKRERLYHEIISNALDYQILVIDEKVIDRINILEATREAMKTIARNLDHDLILSDAMKLDEKEFTYQSHIKGDTLSLNIAAASILAKVSRDRYMAMLALDFPGYELEKHKGYPTRAHLAHLKELGVHERCRFSFGPIRNLAHEKSE